MADYWKSQARKYCDFCKCWIADNKPSIQFHETGKRHKENVAQKLAQLTKRSVKEHHESVKVDEEMRKMEEAAMKSYMKDMESNPDYTLKLVVDKIEEKKKQLELQQQDENKTVGKKKDCERESSVLSSDSVTSSSNSDTKLWYEASSDEGYTYYWNYLTGESVWKPPKEGYMSLEQQKLANSAKELEINDLNEPNDTSIDAEEKNIDVKVDVIKKRKIDEGRGDNMEVCKIGPAMKPDPYGGWTTVEHWRIAEPVDLQLPEQEYVEIKVPFVEAEQPQLRFKEKTLSSLGVDEQGPSTFKKRKFNSLRANMRQKLDDNDE